LTESDTTASGVPNALKERQRILHWTACGAEPLKMPPTIGRGLEWLRSRTRLFFGQQSSLEEQPSHGSRLADAKLRCVKVYP
jgi:hypothetical protein